MARNITVVSADWTKIIITNVPETAQALAEVDYRALFNDGSEQRAQYRTTINNVVPGVSVTGAQAKQAVEQMIGFVSAGIKTREGIP